MTIVAISSLAMLTACAPENHVLTPTETPQISASPTGEGTFDPETDPVNPSVGVDCRTLVDDQTIYDWGSGNFALDTSYEPAPESAAAQLVALGGIACRWVNLTSSETVDVAVAIPSATQLADAEAAASATSELAPAISDRAYFRADGSAGHVDIFTDKYWIAADSTWFVSPSDAAPLLQAALSALG